MDEIIIVEIIERELKRRKDTILGNTSNTENKGTNESAEATETNGQSSRRIQKAEGSCKPREQIISIKRG